MEIRILVADDAAEFWKLRLGALQDSPDAFGATYSEEVNQPIDAIRNKFIKEWSQGDNFVLGAFIESGMVGCAGFRREHREKLRHKGTI